MNRGAELRTPDPAVRHVVFSFGLGLSRAVCGTARASLITWFAGRQMEIHAGRIMSFEWDPSKATANLAKHRVLFEEAASVFGDSLSATAADPEHSTSEARFLTFGLSSRGRILVVSHSDRRGAIRIISARVATRTERRIYEED